MVVVGGGFLVYCFSKNQKSFVKFKIHSLDAKKVIKVMKGTFRGCRIYQKKKKSRWWYAFCMRQG